MDTLNVLVIGNGSMGKRRIRCLKTIGIKNIFVYDIREDRTTENNINDCIKKNNINTFIISTPPQSHSYYIIKALENNINFFVEAGTLNTDIDKIQQLLYTTNIIHKSSDTLMYHPAIIKIKELLESNTLGSISNVIYHCGQYLPDWHTYEKVSDFYVSQKESGGCRELIPFELTWITKLFGFPQKIFGINKKTIDILGASDIDDLYSIILEYNTMTINIIIDVVSREAVRKLEITGSLKTLNWDWNNKFITCGSDKYEFDSDPSFTGYNKNITETMYVNELGNFIISIIDPVVKVSNTYWYDLSVLNILYSIEQSYLYGKTITFNNTAILINVRLNSSRLPKKHLIKILDKPYIEYLIDRLKSTNIKIIINTTYLQCDKELSYLKNFNVNIFHGDPDNIPLRQLQCSKHFGLSHVISVDGDDILTSISAINDIYKNFIDNPKINYIITSGLPFGMNCFGYCINTIEPKIKNINKKIFDTGWNSIFNDITTNEIKYNFNTNIRMTLDYDIDSTFFETIIKLFNGNVPIDDQLLINSIISNNIDKINIHVMNDYWINFNKIKKEQHNSS